jgi:hypothetical protein
MRKKVSWSFLWKISSSYDKAQKIQHYVIKKSLQFLKGYTNTGGHILTSLRNQGFLTVTPYVTA